jgi:hypothetical protein
MYMRQIEPWLDATGWGTTWPSLKARDPDPDGEPLTDNGDSSGPTIPGCILCGPEDNENSADEESGEDVDMSELEDEDGEDPEQPEEDDKDGEDGEENRASSGPTHENTRSWDRDGRDVRDAPSGGETDEPSGDETDEGHL